MLRIQQITTEGLELNACIVLFQEYANELNEDLCFQSFDNQYLIIEFFEYIM